MQYNTWLINMLILKNEIRHQKFRKILTVKDRLQVQVITLSEHIKLNKLNCLLTSYKQFRMKTTELSTKLKTWWHAVSVIKHMKIDNLVNCLTVFIKENWNETDDLCRSDTQVNTWKNNSVWAEKYFIMLSTFLITWKCINKDADDLEKLKKKYVRCSSSWQSWDYWWWDYVWVQKHQDEQHQVMMLKSLIIIIISLYILVTSIKLTHEKLYAMCVKWTKLSEIENHSLFIQLLHAVETTRLKLCIKFVHVDHTLKNECSSHFKLLQKLHFHHYSHCCFEIFCDRDDYLIVQEVNIA